MYISISIIYLKHNTQTNKREFALKIFILIYAPTIKIEDRLYSCRVNSRIYYIGIYYILLIFFIIFSSRYKYIYYKIYS